MFTQDYPKAIIFDLDGTLVDSVPDLCQGLNAALSEMCANEHGALKQVDTGQVRLWVGNGSVKLIQRAIQHLEIEPDKLETLHQYFLKHYQNYLCDSSYLYPGVAALLEKCQQLALPMALVTNKPIAFVPELLEKLGIAHHFKILLGGDSLPEKKPSSMPLLHAANYLNVKPNHCLMVGDSSADRASAQQADMPCVLLQQGYNQGQDLSKLSPEWLLPDIESLLNATIRP